MDREFLLRYISNLNLIGDTKIEMLAIVKDKS
jgi:hypothetical protein